MEQEQYDFAAGMSKASCLRELEQGRSNASAKLRCLAFR